MKNILRSSETVLYIRYTPLASEQCPQLQEVNGIHWIILMSRLHLVSNYKAFVSSMIPNLRLISLLCDIILCLSQYV